MVEVANLECESGGRGGRGRVLVSNCFEVPLLTPYSFHTLSLFLARALSYPYSVRSTPAPMNCRMYPQKRLASVAAALVRPRRRRGGQGKQGKVRYEPVVDKPALSKV